MNRRTSIALRTLAGLALGLSTAPARAFCDDASITVAVAAAAPAQVVQPVVDPVYICSEQRLDDLLAPIALYPDPLLAQVLAASTYPLDVVVAARWASQHPALEGVDAQGWDPSVAAVARYPSVLTMLNDKLEWTIELGRAFQNQPQDVLKAVQRLRSRAVACGTLVTTREQRVVITPTVIEVVPAQVDVIYVPIYEPRVVYISRAYAYREPCVTFSSALTFGWWLDLGCDWENRCVTYRHWRPHHRDEWRDHRFAGGPKPRVEEHQPYIPRQEDFPRQGPRTDRSVEGTPWKHDPKRDLATEAKLRQVADAQGGWTNTPRMPKQEDQRGVQKDTWIAKPRPVEPIAAPPKVDAQDRKWVMPTKDAQGSGRLPAPPVKYDSPQPVDVKPTNPKRIDTPRAPGKGDFSKPAPAQPQVPQNPWSKGDPPAPRPMPAPAPMDLPSKSTPPKQDPRQAPPARIPDPPKPAPQQPAVKAPAPPPPPPQAPRQGAGGYAQPSKDDASKSNSGGGFQRGMGGGRSRD